MNRDDAERLGQMFADLAKDQMGAVLKQERLGDGRAASYYAGARDAYLKASHTMMVEWRAAIDKAIEDTLKKTEAENPVFR